MMSHSMPWRISIPSDSLAQRLDLFPLARHLVHGELAARPRALRVIGDRHVFISELLGGEYHRFGAVAAVAPGRVRVQVAADVTLEHELGQGVIVRGSDFVAAEAQFRRNERQVEAVIQVVFGRAGNRALLAVRQSRIEQAQAAGVARSRKAATCIEEPVCHTSAAPACSGGAGAA
jgi:hypothetical protein